MHPLGKVETSLWSEFVQGIRNLLGIPKKETTLLDQIVQASEVLMADEIDFVEDLDQAQELVQNDLFQL